MLFLCTLSSYELIMHFLLKEPFLLTFHLIVLTSCNFYRLLYAGLSLVYTVFISIYACFLIKKPVPSNYLCFSEQASHVCHKVSFNSKLFF